MVVFLTNVISQSAVAIITSLGTYSNPAVLAEQVESALWGLKLRSTQGHPSDERTI